MKEYKDAGGTVQGSVYEEPWKQRARNLRAEGKSNREIGDKLGVSVKGVERFFKKDLQKVKQEQGETAESETVVSKKELQAWMSSKKIMSLAQIIDGMERQERMGYDSDF